jgi:hypothetical protein
MLKSLLAPASSSSQTVEENPNKILLAIDLDYAHFKTHKRNAVEWIGEKQFWLDLYGEVIAYAALHGFETILAIISKKPTFDDIATEAALSFSHFLQKANPHMFLDHASKRWCLVNCHGTLRYECLTSTNHMTMVPPHTPSHVILLRGEDSKANAISQLASFHQIPTHRCMMVDDTPDVLRDIANNGMHPLSLTCFHNESIDIALLDDVGYVEKNLATFRTQLKAKFEELVNKVTVSNEAVPVISQPTPTRAYPISLQSLSQVMERFELDDAEDQLSSEMIRVFSLSPALTQPHYIPFKEIPSALELLSTSPTLKGPLPSHKP